MAGKVFKRAHKEDPIWFDVEVDPVDGVDQPRVRFHCKDDIPGGVMFAFSGEDDTDGTEASSDMVKAAKDLFNHAIVSNQQALFWDMVNDAPGAPGFIGLSMMLDIAEYISETYAARPTGGSSGAGSPKTSNGSASTGGASAGASTYSRPELVAPTT